MCGVFSTNKIIVISLLWISVFNLKNHFLFPVTSKLLFFIYIRPLLPNQWTNKEVKIKIVVDRKQCLCCTMATPPFKWRRRRVGGGGTPSLSRRIRVFVSRKSVFRYLLLTLAIIAIIPPVYFHFSLRHFHQVSQFLLSFLRFTIQFDPDFISSIYNLYLT